MRHTSAVCSAATGHLCRWHRAEAFDVWDCECRAPLHGYRVTGYFLSQWQRTHPREMERILLREPATAGHRYADHNEHLRAHREYARLIDYGPIAPGAGPRSAIMRDLERPVWGDRPDAGCYTLPDGDCVGRGCMHDVGIETFSGVHPLSRGPAPTLGTIDRIMRDEYLPAIRRQLSGGSTFLEHLRSNMPTTVESLREEAARLAEKADRLERRITDDFEPDTVLSWHRVFPSFEDKAYFYAAIKADDGYWYLTGQETGPHGWDRLVEEHLDKASDGPWIASAWRPQATLKQRPRRRTTKKAAPKK